MSVPGGKFGAGVGVGGGTVHPNKHGMGKTPHSCWSVYAEKCGSILLRGSHDIDKGCSYTLQLLYVYSLFHMTHPYHQ